MVEPHGCDDRQFGRVNDVGRIQRAALADLQHHDVAPAARKIQHSQAGDEFKLRRMLRHRLRVRIHLRGQRGERLIRNGLSVHLHPLVKPVDKRRDVQPHPVSGRPQDGRHHGRRAALAVGAGHVDKPQRPLRVAQPPQQLLRARKAGNAAAPRDGMDICKRLVVVHSFSPVLPFRNAAVSESAGGSGNRRSWRYSSR